MAARKAWRPLAAGALLLLVLAALGWRALQKPAPQRYSVTWFDVFDTVTTVQGYAESEDEWNEQMQALHADLVHLHELFDIYHHYDGLTNLCDVNAGAALAPMEIDEELYNFLQFAVQKSRETGGACNVAAGALLRLWHEARESGELPPQAMLEVAAAHGDIDDVQLQNGMVHFADPALKLDVGAVAKGYAIDRAAQWAESRGLTSALLNVGGSVRAIGQKPDGSAWTAGVENPWPDENGQYHLADMTAAVRLDEKCTLVISGDYQRYVEIDGVRYHHLIDLQTLQPARYASSVAVLGVSSGDADAWSTALFCLPPDEGLRLVESDPALEALWMLPDGTTQASSGWAQYEL